MNQAYDPIKQGSTLSIEFEGYPRSGARVLFVSGTITVLDKNKEPLPGFTTPFECDVVDGRLRYTAAWGDEPGQLPAPQGIETRYVEWDGTDANGVRWVSVEEYEWTHKPRRGG